MPIDIQSVKTAAAGHWQQILPALTGIDGQLLDGRNHPCVRCGGTDRFRMVDIACGALFCNQCFASRNGDGVAAVMWLTGVTFGEALREVAEFLRMVPVRAGRQPRAIQFEAKAAPVRAAKKPITFRTQMLAMSRVIRVMDHQGFTHVQDWTYLDATERPVAFVMRFNAADGSKQFRPVSLWPDGWRIAGPPAPRPLYRLSQLSGPEMILVVEGEKSADAAVKLGYWATTSMNGSKSPEKTDWTPLRGKRIIILPDNDEPGMKYAMAVTTIVSGLGCDVRIVELPGLGPGGDIADWTGTREELRKLIG